MQIAEPGNKPGELNIYISIGKVSCLIFSKNLYLKNDGKGVHPITEVFVKMRMNILQQRYKKASGVNRMDSKQNLQMTNQKKIQTKLSISDHYSYEMKH